MGGDGCGRPRRHRGAGLLLDSGPRPEGPVSAVCAERIADIEKQLAKAGREGDDGVLTFSRVEGGAADDCDEELRDHFGGGR